MRSWFKYFISKKRINISNNRFLFTNYQLIKNQDITNPFIFSKFKKNKTLFKQYIYFKKNLDRTKKVFFIGSSWGVTEFFLRKKLNVVASDVAKEYIKYHRKNTKLKFVKFDVLRSKNSKIKYDQIVINNIEYLFNDNELKKCIKNVSRICKPNGNVYVVFRSRDSILVKFIDEKLIFIEQYLLYLFKSLSKKVYFNKFHHGYRRTLNEFLNMWENQNFMTKYVYTDLYELEFQRLGVVEKLNISKILSKIFLNSSPYLNIITFKKKIKNKS